MHLALVALTASFGCAADTNDCASLAVRYGNACPATPEDVEAVIEICEELDALDDLTSCRFKTRALQSCIAADWGGALGVHCGDALFNLACSLEADAVRECFGAPPSGESACIGHSISCSNLSGGSACDAQLGCIADGSNCSGQSWYCYEFNSTGSCGAQRGCQWERPEAGGLCIGSPVECERLSAGSACDAQLGCITAGSDCRGLSLVCHEFISTESCGAQRGCQWERFELGGDCRGYSVDCESLSAGSACDAQLGCFTAGSDCSGESVPCFEFISTESCGAQLGCQWEMFR
ncbi:MAG: hypothetical protein MUE69_07585 [Myxococcota bacterium]|jgi:hypothetical protein|nr:hypothetical protein [Myxococcota bacterium]